MDHVNAHDHSSRHRDVLLKSQVCGCFHCMKTFSPTDIVEWTDRKQTAICPKCGIDSVIGDASGFPVTGEFLQEMCDYWFAAVPHVN
jgi:hypothetical protein